MTLDTSHTLDKSYLVASLDGYVAISQMMSHKKLKHQVSQHFCRATWVFYIIHTAVRYLIYLAWQKRNWAKDKLSPVLALPVPNKYRMNSWPSNSLIIPAKNFKIHCHISMITMIRNYFKTSIVIYLRSECIEKHLLCSKYYREHGSDIMLGRVVPCRKLGWICRNQSNDVAQQVKTPGKSIFLSHDMNCLSRRTLHYTMTVKHTGAVIHGFLVLLPLKCCDMLQYVHWEEISLWELYNW